MTRATVYLPDKLHKGLQHMVDRRHISLAELLREAAEEIFREDISDLRVGRQRFEQYKSGAMVAESYAAYRKELSPQH